MSLGAQQQSALSLIQMRHDCLKLRRQHLRGLRRHTEPISTSRGLRDAVVLKDGDGLAQVARFGRAA
ncbi:hypothetical protein, partial [Nonomuraea angiospora]|uniref:hypothetical protein n=1 Tax=Nonomuraea angiospora TaxID=46172 RepID=UPI0029ADAA05